MRYGIVLIVLIALILLISGAGCLHTPEKKAYIELSFIENNKHVSAGQNTTYILLVKNKWDDANISLSSSSSSEISVRIFNPTLYLPYYYQSSTLITVSTSSDTSTGKYSIYVHATIKDVTSSKIKLSINVIEKSGATVNENKEVRLNFFGYLSDGKLFETNMESIGKNDNIPKASVFMQGTYSIIEHVVGTSPESGGQVVAGLDKGIRGMVERESRTVTVIPGEGYGKYENITVPVEERLPLYTKVNRSEFNEKFKTPETPEVNKVIQHWFWGWYFIIVDVGDDYVTVMAQVKMNGTYTPYTWETKVIGINSEASNGTGEIIVRHFPENEMNITYKDITGNYPGKVVAIEGDNIKIIYMRFNVEKKDISEVTLYYDVNVIEIV